MDMDYDQWYDTFRPKVDDEGVVINYETYGDDWEIIRNTDYHYVWTLVDGDYGTWIVEGRAFVNRILYFITEEPWKDGETYNILDQEYGQDPDEDDEEMELV